MASGFGRDLTGLTDREAAGRLAKAGPNRIRPPRKVSFFRIAREEVMEPMILLLLAVGFFYSLWGRLEDAVTIFIIILLLVFVEVWNEYRAKKAIASLSRVAAPKASVWRNSSRREVPTEDVVPGDVLLLSPGTRVAADARLVIAYSVAVDESALTGESFPVEKKAGEELFAGTVIVSGEGEAEVFATGMNTRMGRLSRLAGEIREPKTPLQKTMKSLAFALVWVALFFSIAIPLLGYLRGLPVRTAILTGLALSFAVIPEELPIIITMVLGLGAYQLSRDNFLVKTLRAAEALGGATVILTDKTGTITENRMTVASVHPPGHDREVMHAAVEAMAAISRSPTDTAIRDHAEALDVKASGIILREQSFNPVRKTVALLRRMPEGPALFMAGAPEAVLKKAKDPRPDLEQALEKETSRGRRVIAVAVKPVAPSEENLPFDQMVQSVEVVGLLGIEDPPRPGVKETVARAGEAGVRTIMVTGDHPGTAVCIAGAVGIPNREVLTGDDLGRMSDEEIRAAVKRCSVFARTTPEDKYRLVQALKQDGEVVAVTGDGINDALALKAADIGISMGIRGTDVAKEAADIVIANDDYVTLAHGIFQGRKFFENLKKALRYYLSVKTALILVFLAPVLLAWPLPLAPIQIILLELFMDLAASAGFVGEPAERSIYDPDRDRKLFDQGMLSGIAVSGLSLFAAVFGSYSLALQQGMGLIQAQTSAFTAWIIGHIFLAFVSRSAHEPLLSLGPFSNRVMDVWALAAFAFLIAALALPDFGLLVRVSPLPPGQILVIVLICAVAVFWQEVVKTVRYRSREAAVPATKANPGSGPS
ncbi:MAG TPA: cation-transporting P-type ATPase [Deltaproteobacteria bacterium]|jgi:Ca2+-transporting ATPase|nr:cation-transporting P-type ATPase [Deltaproteobacteria bacterium]HOI06249.1 cation-transporting P-type ATPase [Deltaproteobacteria bacterium]